MYFWLILVFSIHFLYLSDSSRNDAFILVFRRNDAAQIIEQLEGSVRVSENDMIACNVVKSSGRKGGLILKVYKENPSQFSR